MIQGLISFSRRFCLVVCLLLLGSAMYGQNAPELLAKARQAYNNFDYLKAAEYLFAYKLIAGGQQSDQELAHLDSILRYSEQQVTAGLLVKQQLSSHPGKIMSVTYTSGGNLMRLPKNFKHNRTDGGDAASFDDADLDPKSFQKTFPFTVPKETMNLKPMFGGGEALKNTQMLFKPDTRKLPKKKMVRPNSLDQLH